MVGEGFVYVRIVVAFDIVWVFWYDICGVLFILVMFNEWL